MSSGFLLGLDVGSSSIKAALVDISSGKGVARATSPKTELSISADKPGWAEQPPELWWEHVCQSILELKSQFPAQIGAVRAIGISYQMHGLVVLDKNSRPLRPSIIWCDSRAVSVGERAFAALTPQLCREKLLNSPGNFTAAKLAWVKENEPKIFAQVAKACLPGDFIATRLTGEVKTTRSGLSEGILWNFDEEKRADFLLNHLGIDPDILPTALQSFEVSGTVLDSVAQELGLPKGVVVSYRAGDQPNNALSLNVLEPEEVAATAGTSGVVYGVTDKKRSDIKSRVNTFLHVNHTPEAPRLGVLLCVNGTGSLYRWMRQSLGIGSSTVSYEQLNNTAKSAPIGSRGLVVLPYGNGAERTLENLSIGGSIRGLDFNRHCTAELTRASQEGIVFALNYGLEIMKGVGVSPRKVRAGRANMFLSPLFAETFAGVTGAAVELYDTDGAEGAARGAGLGCGVWRSREDAFKGMVALETIDPSVKDESAYQEAYGVWKGALELELDRARPRLK